MWPHIRPLLFYSGETSDIPDIDPKPAAAKADSGTRIEMKPEAVKVKVKKQDKFTSHSLSNSRTKGSVRDYNNTCLVSPFVRENGRERRKKLMRLAH